MRLMPRRAAMSDIARPKGACEAVPPPVRIGRKGNLHCRTARTIEDESLDHGNQLAFASDSQPRRSGEVERCHVSLDGGPGHLAQEAHPQIFIGEPQQVCKHRLPRVFRQRRNRRHQGTLGEALSTCAMANPG